MALKYEQNNYVIPRGRVFFNPRNPATDQLEGEIYLGNCPGFAIAIESEKAEHFSSETGLSEKDASVVIRVNRTANITCDNMNAANTALFLSGSQGEQTQTAGVVDDSAPEVITVIPGRTYQLGVGETAPVGRRRVSNVVVMDQTEAKEYQPGVDYNLDAERGILQIIKGGTITDGEVLHVTYDYAACTWQDIRSGNSGNIKGALRVAADNATGANLDFYLPSVTLSPSGDLSAVVEGTDWNQMTFEADVLRPANGEAVYVNGLPAGLP